MLSVMSPLSIWLKAFRHCAGAVITFLQDTFFEARLCSADYTTNTGWRRWPHEGLNRVFADDSDHDGPRPLVEQTNV
jgi:hypothetical protein